MLSGKVMTPFSKSNKLPHLKYYVMIETAP